MSRRKSRASASHGWATDARGHAVSTVIWALLDVSMEAYLAEDSESPRKRLLRGIVRGNAQCLSEIVEGLSVKNAELISKRRVVGED